MQRCARAFVCAEERVENITEASEILEPVKAAGTVAAHAGVPESVVVGPFFRVGQYLVGLVDLLELLGCAVFLVPVGGDALTRAYGTPS